MKKNYFFTVSNSDLDKVGGNFELLCWYSALSRYADNFKPDSQGFTRVASSVFESDFGVDRFKALRLNKKLAELGLIQYDQGGRRGKGKENLTGIKIIG